MMICKVKFLLWENRREREEWLVCEWVSHFHLVGECEAKKSNPGNWLQKLHGHHFFLYDPNVRSKKEKANKAFHVAHITLRKDSPYYLS